MSEQGDSIKNVPLDNVTKTIHGNGIMSFQYTPGTKQEVNKMKKDEYLVYCGKSRELFCYIVNSLGFLYKRNPWFPDDDCFDRLDNYCITFDKFANYTGWCNKEYYNNYYTFIKEFDAIKDAEEIHNLLIKGHAAAEMEKQTSQNVTIKTDAVVIEKIGKPARDSHGRFLSKKTVRAKKELSNKIEENKKNNIDNWVRYKVASFNYLDNKGEITWNRRIAVTSEDDTYLSGFCLYRREFRQFLKEKVKNLAVKFEEIKDLPISYKVKVISNCDYYINPVDQIWEYTKYVFIDNEKSEGYFMMWDGTKKNIINLDFTLESSKNQNYRKVSKGIAESYYKNY